MQSRHLFHDNLFHCANLLTRDWSAACKRFRNAHGESFVPYARNDYESGVFDFRDRVFARKAAPKGDSSDSQFVRFSFKRPALGSVSDNLQGIIWRRIALHDPATNLWHAWVRDYW
jgi:hypothetical protein